MSDKFLHNFLNDKYVKYHNTNFIENDPIFIPHQYKLKQDIEISAFFASIFAWGKRSVIIQKASLLMKLMDNAPYDFIKNYNTKDLYKLKNFKHRTFNFEDIKFFLMFLKLHYLKNASLEDAFLYDNKFTSFSMEESLNQFYDKIFSLDCLSRTKRHISCPKKKSLCKRINMFLRWMVRKGIVDFGIWEKIPISSLILPCDVHVLRVAKKLGILNSDKKNWQTAIDLTNVLKNFCPEDPVKYDFALFGTGVEETVN